MRNLMDAFALSSREVDISGADGLGRKLGIELGRELGRQLGS